MTTQVLSVINISIARIASPDESEDAPHALGVCVYTYEWGGRLSLKVDRE
jgi:hypothetical protein